MEKIKNFEFSRNNIIGKGATSIVYIGKYLGIDNDILKYGTSVAIKIINIKNINQKTKEVLNEEISIMQLFKYNYHPNIIKCFDIVEKTNEILIIMEYCDSGDLRNLLKKPIKEKYAQYYFCQLANGLKFLEKLCIIHRDIKPKNILITNNKKTLKIADFGFAKKLSNHQLSETICGSPLYMAPEIFNNTKYNNQIDLWSIGMILYEILYGFHPLANCKSVPELKNRLELDIIEIPPKFTKNNVSDNCIDLLHKLLEKKVINRITWSDFFNHPWVISYNHVFESKPYTNQLISISNESKSNSTDSNSSRNVSPKSFSPNIFNSKSFNDYDDINIIPNYLDNIKNNKDKNKDKDNDKDDLIFHMD